MPLVKYRLSFRRISNTIAVHPVGFLILLLRYKLFTQQDFYYLCSSTGFLPCRIINTIALVQGCSTVMSRLHTVSKFGTLTQNWTHDLKVKYSFCVCFVFIAFAYVDFILWSLTVLVVCGRRMQIVDVSCLMQCRNLCKKYWNLPRFCLGTERQ